MNRKKHGPSYTREDLSFVKEPPEEISIECPICLQIMSKDISQTSCGHHFCTSCIERVLDKNESCPECRATCYRIFPDANRQRIIGGLQVYCSNKKDGCTWKGELKNLSGHINKYKREGDCQFQVVHCHYWKKVTGTFSIDVEILCPVKKKRADLADHEGNECPYRPYTCQYCGDKDTYQVITGGHYDWCPRYPVPCSNECDPKKTMPREEVDDHIKNDCPLEPVACELCWAGCTARPQRKDIEQHITSNQIKHFKLLAKACRELKKENAELRKELKDAISQSGFKKYRYNF